jgi:hypothetical protein
LVQVGNSATQHDSIWWLAASGSAVWRIAGVAAAAAATAVVTAVSLMVVLEPVSVDT